MEEEKDTLFLHVLIGFFSAYLETNKQSNVSLYQHFGFQLSEQGLIPGNNVMHYAMIRPPQTIQLKELLSVDGMINLIDDYIHWYNNQRIQKKLGYLSPCDFRKLET